jgi:hypothetical protein
METKVVELDVREDINNKREPFQKIMAAVSTFVKGDILVLHAPFSPAPLLGVFKAKGFNSEEQKLEEHHYKIIFTKL